MSGLDSIGVNERSYKYYPRCTVTQDTAGGEVNVFQTRKAASTTHQISNVADGEVFGIPFYDMKKSIWDITRTWWCYTSGWDFLRRCTTTISGMLSFPCTLTNHIRRTHPLPYYSLRTLPNLDTLAVHLKASYSVASIFFQPLCFQAVQILLHLEISLTVINIDNSNSEKYIDTTQYVTTQYVDVRETTLSF